MKAASCVDILDHSGCSLRNPAEKNEKLPYPGNLLTMGNIHFSNFPKLSVFMESTLGTERFV